MAPTDARRRQTYLPSLLDRLQDDAPRRRSEHPDAYAPNAERMRRLVERDLALLLNATNLESDLDIERFPAAAASVVNYGMPPLSGGYVGTHHADAIAKLIRTAVLRFEPRLIPDSLAIRPIPDPRERHYNRVVFEIRGLLHWSPYPLEFRVQSTFDLEMSQVALDSTIPTRE